MKLKYSIFLLKTSGPDDHDWLGSIFRGRARRVSSIEDFNSITEYLESLQGRVRFEDDRLTMEGISMDGISEYEIDFSTLQLGWKLAIVERLENGNIHAAYPVSEDIENTGRLLIDDDIAENSIALAQNRLEGQICSYLLTNQVNLSNGLPNPIGPFVNQIINSISVPPLLYSESVISHAGHPEEYVLGYLGSFYNLLLGQQQQQQQQQQQLQQQLQLQHELELKVNQHFNQLQAQAEDPSIQLANKIDALKLKLDSHMQRELLNGILKEHFRCPISLENIEKPVYIKNEHAGNNTYELESLKMHIRWTPFGDDYKSPISKMEFDLKDVQAGYGSKEQKLILVMSDGQFRNQVVNPCLKKIQPQVQENLEKSQLKPPSLFIEKKQLN